VPWYDPNKLSKTLEAALAKSFPDINLNTNHVFTFEALLVAADAYKRAKSADPKALADAIRTTNITDNVSVGPGIQFDAKGQNDKVKFGGAESRRQAGHGGAQGRGERQARIPDDPLRQACLTLLCADPAPAARAVGASFHGLSQWPHRST
jgi:hypothetical protein